MRRAGTTFRVRLHPQRPDQMLNAPWIESRRRRRQVGVRGQGERRVEQLAVVAFQTAPQPGVRVQIFAKLDQDGGQLAQRLLRPDHGTIGKAALALLQHSAQFLGNLRQILVCAARRTRRAGGTENVGDRDAHDLDPSRLLSCCWASAARRGMRGRLNA